MAALRPYPFDALVRRMFRELETRRAVFDLPERSFFTGEPELDLSVRFHGERASCPLGPAAGPHTQMAQNLVLAWLAGCRILELKTVQVMDRLEIPRPCIDVQTVGYNVEWSQELALHESLEEYVKGAMLIEMLRRSKRVPLADGLDRTLFDISVGYDLEGIRSPRVQGFLRAMTDAREVIERLRAQIPSEHRALRELGFPERISGSVTLSTFHGCPPGEIEGILEFLLEECRLHCTVKLNPTLLGARQTRLLLHEVLGYTELSVPEEAFERDTTWEQMEEFVERLAARAAGAGLGFGVKFSNTLIVENHRDFLPTTEKRVYLSGQPLHVLAMQLVGRFRERFGTAHPISFAAGIDRGNFPDAVALGLVPVTVCTDLLRPGGYRRARLYLGALVKRMREVGARSVPEFILRAYGHAPEALRKAGQATGRDIGRARAALERGADLREAAGEALFDRWVSEATLLNTRTYVEELRGDPRYHRGRNAKVPKKIGRQLELFDCISCDKCIPVCPNGANFAFVMPRAEIPVARLRRRGRGWTSETAEPLRIEESHQIGNFADFCNDCGNCDVFCPQDGGPYAVKPRFFGSRLAYREAAPGDGFLLEGGPEGPRMFGRFGGREFRLERAGAGRIRYSGEGFEITLDPADPEGTARGEAEGVVDLTHLRIMEHLARALLGPEAPNWVSELIRRS